MKVEEFQSESGSFAFALTHEGAKDLFSTQTALLQILLQQRATLLAQNRLLFDLVAELRNEDVEDVEARFANFQRDQLQELYNDLKEILPGTEFSPRK